MPSIQDLFTGEFDPTWGSVADIDYDPTSGQSFQDWLSGQGDLAGTFDIDFGTAATQYNPDSFDLHELGSEELPNQQGISDADWFASLAHGDHQPSMMEMIAIAGFVEDIPAIGEDGTIDWLSAEEPTVGEISAMRHFISEQTPFFSLIAGGPDLGTVGTDGELGTGLIGEYELKEQQLYESLAGFSSAYGMEGQLGENIAALEGKYDEAIEAANLQRKASLDEVNRSKSAMRQSTVEGLVSAGRGTSKGVRGSGKRASVMLDSQLAALHNLQSQSQFVRQTAADAIQYAGDQFGTWEGGFQTGAPGLRQQALQSNFNAAGMMQADSLRQDLEAMQLEFETLVAAEYDDWYIDLQDRMVSLIGTEYGDGGTDVFDPFGSGDESFWGGTGNSGGSGGSDYDYGGGGGGGGSGGGSGGGGGGPTWCPPGQIKDANGECYDEYTETDDTSYTGQG